MIHETIIKRPKGRLINWTRGVRRTKRELPRPVDRSHDQNAQSLFDWDEIRRRHGVQ